MGERVGIPMAVLYKASVCDRLIDGTARSNPADGVDVRLLCCCVLCR